MSEEIRFGFYSREAERHAGAAVYKKWGSVEEVKVTSVSRDPTDPGCLHKDATFVGRIGASVKAGPPSRFVRLCTIYLLENEKRHKTRPATLTEEYNTDNNE